LIVESYTTSDFFNLTIFNHMPKFFTGGCACGAIRYEVNAEPIAMFNCHCRDCQRMTGGAYTPVVYVPAKAFKLTKGAPCFYDTSSEAMGDNKRAFCPECGSRLFGAITEQARGITASSLDDPTLFKPQFEIWTSEAQPWDHMDPKFQKFEKYAPS
jgi:hypothetical protein